MGPVSYGRQTKKGHVSACYFGAATCWKKFVCVEHGFDCMSRSPPMRGASCRSDHIDMTTTVLMCVSYRIKPYE